MVARATEMGEAAGFQANIRPVRVAGSGARPCIWTNDAACVLPL